MHLHCNILKNGNYILSPRGTYIGEPVCLCMYLSKKSEKFNIPELPMEYGESYVPSPTYYTLRPTYYILRPMCYILLPISYFLRPMSYGNNFIIFLLFIYFMGVSHCHIYK